MSSFVNLTKLQVDAFHNDGYLVLEEFWNAETVDTLKNRIQTILSQFDYESHRVIFTTAEQSRKCSNDYFLESGNKIRFFWEEDARDEFGNLVQIPENCINKIGHALHDNDIEFKKVSYDKRVCNIAQELGLEIPVVVQSMYIFKQPSIGGTVGAHQDGAFLYTEPQTCLGFWWALHDCTTKNGCLWAIPGSHKLGVNRRFRRKPFSNTETEFIPSEPEEWDLSNTVPLEVKAGTLVLLHSALIHGSSPNTSPNPRHAYSIHLIDSRPGVLYPQDNWLQRPPEDPFANMAVEVEKLAE